MKVFPQRVTAWRRRSDCVVSGALYWVLRASQLVGVAPLHFQRCRNARDKWRVKVSHAHSVFNPIRIVILSLFTAALYTNMYKIQKKGTLIMRLSNTANMIFAACICVFGAASRMKIIISVLDQVNEIKAALTRHQKPPVSSEKARTVALVALFIFFCYYSLIDFLRKITTFDIAYVMIVHIMFYMLLLTGLMFIVQFFFVTHEVYAAIKLLNNNLLLLTDDSKSSSGQNHESVTADSKRSSGQNHELRVIVGIHSSIPEIIRQLEDAFGVAVVILSVVGFFKIVYGSAILDFEDSAYMDYWVWINVQILFFGSLVATMESNHKLKLEMNRTKRLAGHLLSISPDSRTTSELVKFSQCLLLGGWNDSTMKLCELSRNSIARICGNIATYIIMVFNFNTTFHTTYKLAPKNRPT